jgi:multidrug efflux pump subunit AcrB
MNVYEGMARRRGLVWFASLALALAGAFVATRLPSGIYPEVEFPRIVVVAHAGDAPPDVTQISLTRPLEAALATVLGVERIRSKTIRGATEMSLQFAPGTDMWRALQLVESRVAATRPTLPPGADIGVERLTTTSFPVLTYNLTGPIDPRRLRELGEFVLKPAFSRVRGVGRVEVLGGDVREIEVILDPDRTVALHLRPSQIAEKLRAQTVLQAVGRLEESHSLVTVMVSGEPAELDDLRAIPVGVGADGSPIPLGAIAEVREGAEDKLLRVAGPGGETVLLSIARLPGASTPEVVSNVEAVARELAVSLPSGVQLTPVYDQAALVDESIRSVRDAILIGIALCVAVIALFLRNLRAGLAASVSVPLTLGATFLPMGILGQSLNLMSLGGLAVAIGLVIDDAIVVIEAIGKRVQEGVAPADAARQATRALLAALDRDHRDHGGGVPPARLVAGRGRPILLGFGDDAFDGGSHLLGGCPDHGPARREAMAAAAPESHATVTLHGNLRSHGAPAAQAALDRLARGGGAPRPGRGQRLRGSLWLPANHGRGSLCARLLLARRDVAR